MQDELEKIVGTKLNGKIITEKISYNNQEKNFYRYVLNPESFIQLRKLLGGRNVRIIMPQSFYTEDLNPTRTNVVLDEDFRIIKLYEG